MKATKKTGPVAAARTAHKVVRTTVGDLIASLFEAAGSDGALNLLGTKSPLQKVLRQRLVLV